MLRFLSIWFPNWPIQRLVIARPQWQGRPVLLHDGPPGSAGVSGRVVACSSAATRCGVAVGMPLAEATALVASHGDSQSGRPSQGSCDSQSPGGSQNNSAGWLATEYDAEGDRQALLELAQWCERFSPVVGWQTVRAGDGTRSAQQRRAAAGGPDDQPPEGLLLDVTGLGRLFGGELRLAQRVIQQLARRGPCSRVAVAGTPGAAWALARFADPAEEKTSSAARPAPVVVPHERQQTALDPLPVEALRLSESTCRTLRRLGVERIAQLRALPRDGLARRLGAVVVERLDQALGPKEPGRVLECIVAVRVRAEVSASWLGEVPIERRRDVEQVLSRLVERLAADLAGGDRGVSRLECRLDCAGSEPLRLVLDLYQPSAEPEHLRQLLALRLESLRLPGAVGRVELEAARTAPRRRRQIELFATGGAGQRRGALARLIDRLSSRLGRHGVLRPILHGDAQPERAYRDRPLAGLRRRRRGTAPPKPGARPLCLLQPAEPIEVLAVAPAGRPQQFTWRGRSWPLVGHWGPERIETGWWRGPRVCRDYYRVQTVSGSRFWLYRDQTSGRWFLQGTFG